MTVSPTASRAVDVSGEGRREARHGGFPEQTHDAPMSRQKQTERSRNGTGLMGDRGSLMMQSD